MNSNTNRNELLHLLFTTNKNFHKLKSKNQLCTSHFYLMLSIYKFGESIEYENEMCQWIYLSTIIERSKVSKAAISRTIHECEEKQYISLVKHTEDKRKMCVILRKKGYEELMFFKNHMDRYMDTIIEKMGEKDLQELIRIVIKLNEILEETGKEEIYV